MTSRVAALRWGALAASDHSEARMPTLLRRPLSHLTALALAAIAVPATVRAQAFRLGEIGACAIARGQAVTAAPCGDPSMIYWNPAATVGLRGWSAYAGIAAVSASGNFTADTTGIVYPAKSPTRFPPSLFLNYGRDRWSAGVGVYVPYGLTSQWGGDFPGRFESEYASLTTVYIQPNFAWRIAPGWKVGGGPVIGHSSVELRQALDLSQQMAEPGVTFGQLGVPAGTQFGMARLTGSATGWGFNVGVHGQVLANLELGIRYLSRIRFNYDAASATFSQTQTGLVLAAGNPLGLPAGTPVDRVLAASFAAGGPLVAQGVSTHITHPDQLAIGLGYTGFTNTTLSLDYEWVGYSAFQTLPVSFKGPAASQSTTLLEDYSNSSVVRAGLEHAFASGIKGRLGIDFIQTPAPAATVTPLLPDMNRRNYTAGLGIPLSPHYALDAAYLHVDTSGRRGRIVERTSPSQTAAQLNGGFYQLSANVFAISIRANY